MRNTVVLDLNETDRRLEYWLDKVEDCFKNEVKKSMNNFRKEIGIEERK